MPPPLGPPPLGPPPLGPPPLRPPPLGPEVDATPRPLPARIPIRGQYVSLEPLHRRHAAELWHAAQGADDSWVYLNYGPFSSAETMTRQIADLASVHERLV